MKDLQVFVHNNSPVTDSRDVAKMVEKRHADLLDSVRTYIEYLTNGKIRSLDFFVEGTYLDGKGETQPNYLITRKGCEFIANKLTGKKGTLFTAAYINAFHEMEKAPVSLQAKRLEIQERNAKAREGKILMQIANHEALSPEARELVLIDAHQFITGKTLPFRPALTEPLMTAEQAAERLGEDIGDAMDIPGLYFTANWIGTIANRYGVKIDKYGKLVLDKKKHCDGQTPAFRYNEAGYARLREILASTDNWPLSMKRMFQVN